MSQRYLQQLHKSSAPERRDTERVSLRRYAHSVKAKSLSKANSYLREFLDDVFSAEGACRFFRTFILRFAFDSNGNGDDSTGRSIRLSGAFVINPVTL